MFMHLFCCLILLKYTTIYAMIMQVAQCLQITILKSCIEYLND